LLAFSRKQALQPRVVRASRLIAGMEDLLRRTLGETINIENRWRSDLWPSLVDPAQLENALLNLAINARDAMPDGGRLLIETSNARLEASDSTATEAVEAGDFVLVSVTDEGEGMPPEVAAQAFDPFFTTKDVGKGSGLGLSMVYGFVKQSGGHVRIQSEQGSGTTIQLFLPRFAGQSEGTNGERAVANDPHGSGQLILVVEDGLEVRQLTTALLARLGYRTVEASSAGEALEQLERTDGIDLLFTDIVLPGGTDGVELAKQVRVKYPEMRMLFTTGYTENAEIHSSRRETGIRLLEKPFTRGRLAHMVHGALDTAVGTSLESPNGASEAPLPRTK
jgi:CheY-like chemotaxis protein